MSVSVLFCFSIRFLTIFLTIGWLFTNKKCTIASSMEIDDLQKRKQRDRYLIATKNQVPVPLISGACPLDFGLSLEQPRLSYD